MNFSSLPPHPETPELVALQGLLGSFESGNLMRELARHLASVLGAQTVQIVRGDKIVSQFGDEHLNGHAVDLAIPRTGLQMRLPGTVNLENPHLGSLLSWSGILLAYEHLSQAWGTAPLLGDPMPVMTDALTLLGSRALLMNRLDGEFAEARRYNHPLTLVLMKVDRFQGLNDDMGRELGDRVLVKCAETIRRCIRGSDLGARFSGSMFAMLLPQTDDRGAVVLAERIREFIAQDTWLDGQGRSFDASVSIGISSFRRKFQAPVHMIEDASRALTEAERRGGNAVVSAQQLDVDAPLVLETQSTLALRELAKALEIAMHAKDPLTGGHARAVGVFSSLVAEAMGLPPERQEFLFLAGLLHDIGKLAIPDEILKKAGPLDDKEWAFMKRHPVIAANMINRLQGFSALHDPILYHHERMDGRGYPEQLPGELIPLEARIITVCDSYDAMTRQRCYSRPRSHADALNELRRCAGSQFDPAIVDIFVNLDLPDPLALPLEAFLG